MYSLGVCLETDDKSHGNLVTSAVKSGILNRQSGAQVRKASALAGCSDKQPHTRLIRGREDNIKIYLKLVHVRGVL
jgi:hypothetical protein